jgi:HAD superfamily hydrolase (TIGR01509 family)
VIPSFPVYLFDVDGTLLESAPDITGALREVLSRYPITVPPQSRLESSIGKHLLELMIELFPDSTEEQREEIIQEYRKAYWARGHRSTNPYPGVVEAIQNLGGRKSTVTTKSTDTTHIVLDKFGLLPYFDHVQGTDGFPAKPEPEVVFRSMQAIHARPQQCLLIGDSEADMAAGRAAGVKICAVDYGYGDPARMQEYKPDFWISDLRELLA